jgi:hypothetical protein
MKKDQLEIFATQDLEETIVCTEAPLYYAMAPLHKKTRNGCSYYILQMNVCSYLFEFLNI